MQTLLPEGLAKEELGKMEERARTDDTNSDFRDAVGPIGAQAAAGRHPELTPGRRIKYVMSGVEIHR